MMEEMSKLSVDEVGVLEKFEGDPIPENLFQRVHVHNGRIIKVEDFENGELVKSYTPKGVN